MPTNIVIADSDSECMMILMGFLARAQASKCWQLELKPLNEFALTGLIIEVSLRDMYFEILPRAKWF